MAANRAMEVMVDVREMASAEAAVDDRMGWEGVREAWPQAEGGAADEHDGVGWSRRDGIDPIEAGDFGVPLVGDGLEGGGGEQHQEDGQPA